MGFYARRPWRFLGQVGGDLLVLGWAVAWWLVGRAVHRMILAVATPARATADAASRASASFREAADQASKVPGLGAALRKPFDAAAGSLTGVISSAHEQVTSIERLASLGGWLVFLIPVSAVAAFWLPRRIGFFVRARAAARFVDSSADLDLFALRAMANAPMHLLARISDDPVSAWRRGDTTVISRLAEIELRRSGLRMPKTEAAVPISHAVPIGKDEDL